MLDMHDRIGVRVVSDSARAIARKRTGNRHQPLRCENGRVQKTIHLCQKTPFAPIGVARLAVGIEWPFHDFDPGRVAPVFHQGNGAAPAHGASVLLFRILQRLCKRDIHRRRLADWTCDVARAAGERQGQEQGDDFHAITLHPCGRLG